MPNPILPLWEYIPDAEPRVFGNRVYLYGSHDRPASEEFCDWKLKVWSADVNDLNNWQCHGDSFRTADGKDRKADTSEWTNNLLFAPDVVEKDGKYYLYTYIVGAEGAVSVSDKPEGPFKLIGRYNWKGKKVGDDGIFNDPGVLVDDDGRVYVYYGFTESNMNELDPDDMHTVIDGSYMRSVIEDTDNAPDAERFFEASSPRKIGDTYYMIYSPKIGSRLAYATSDSPRGPFRYRGYIIDNSVDYPGGNDHGSIACINGQWYVFYHKMTNGTIMSRRVCAEKIEILPDGTIPTVEMTSLGFEDALDPYKITPAEIACVLKNGCFITEKDLFERVVTNITDGCVIGYKYFDFGDDFTGDSMQAAFKVRGMGTKCRLRILADSYETGEELGVCEIGTGDGIYMCRIKNITGRHSIFFVADNKSDSWTAQYFVNKQLFELSEFVFIK